MGAAVIQWQNASFPSWTSPVRIRSAAPNSSGAAGDPAAPDVRSAPVAGAYGQAAPVPLLAVVLSPVPQTANVPFALLEYW
jgi:hypothetical protein